MTDFLTSGNKKPLEIYSTQICRWYKTNEVTLLLIPSEIGIIFSGAGNGRIAVRVLAKTRAKSFSLWRVNFSVLAPKRKNSRATSFGSMDDVFPVRKRAAEKNYRTNYCVIGFCFYLCNRKRAMGSYQSGQMGLTVTQLAYAFGGSNPSLPTPFRHQECGSSSVDRALAFQAKGRGFEPRLPLYAD